MKDATVTRLHALADPDPCELCADKRAALLTSLAGLPVLGVVACPLCESDQPARVIPTRMERPRTEAS